MVAYWTSVPKVAGSSPVGDFFFWTIELSKLVCFVNIIFKKTPIKEDPGVFL